MKYLGPPQSGSRADITAARNTYGQYYRARVGRGGVPVRSIAGAVAAWQALTEDQQLAWWTWDATISRSGSLGTKRQVGGPARFCSSWLLAALFGQVVTNAPVGRATLSLASVAISNVARVVTFGATLAATGSGTGWVELQLVFPASSSGTTRPPGRGRYWRFVGGGSAGAGSGASTSLDYSFIVGSRVWGRARLIGDDWIAQPWLMAGPVAI